MLLSNENEFNELAQLLCDDRGFPEHRNTDLEPMIANEAELAYLYARDVINGRFELGEKAIATCPYISLLYALDVINGRFELGEQAIKTEERCWNDYCEHFGM